eukprot:gene1006-biopygen821
MAFQDGREQARQARQETSHLSSQQTVAMVGQTVENAQLRAQLHVAQTTSTVTRNDADMQICSVELNAQATIQQHQLLLLLTNPDGQLKHAPRNQRLQAELEIMQAVGSRKTELTTHLEPRLRAEGDNHGRVTECAAYCKETEPSVGGCICVPLCRG